MKTLALLLVLFNTSTSKVIYNNPIYKISCTKIVEGDTKIYSIHGQDHRFEHFISLINIYSGENVIDYIDEVYSFVKEGQKGEAKTIQGTIIKVNYKSMSFDVLEANGGGYIMIPTKAWLKMRKKIIEDGFN